MTFLSVALFACFLAAVFGSAWGAAAVLVDYPYPRITWSSRVHIAAIRAVHWCAWLVLRAYACTRPRRVITAPDGTPLITRWFLSSRPAGDSTGTSGWYLHRFEHYDTLRSEHNHPWSYARTRVLRGWYIETRNGVLHSRSAGQTAELYPHEYHRVVALRPGTWTLFYAGPKHGRGWGFR